jgi:Carboxypeptidase regulatory-like domain
MQRLCLFVLLLFAPRCTFGQTLGEITGEIRDVSGGALVGANVTVSAPARGATRSTSSNDAGVFRFPALLPGSYNLKVEMTGFRTAARSGIELQVQQIVRADFTLQVGEITQVVDVSDVAGLLNTEDSTVGTVVENRRIVELPLNGRNFLQLVSLTPNVSFGFSTAGTVESRQGGLRSQQNISIAGQRTAFNRFTLDGIENTDVNFLTYVFLPSIDALQEFKVQSGVFPAEFGRATGQINVSTKSGTNQLHGALFEFIRNDKLDAKNYAFTQNRPKKDPFKLNQYGVTVGGPIWLPKLVDGRNRLFFLSNFEGVRDRKQRQGIFNVPSAAMREGDFSQNSNPIYDPATRISQGGAVIASPFPNNIIPRNRFHSVSTKFLEFIPAPNVNTGSLVSNYQTGLNRKINRDQFSQRIDLVESSSSNWFGRYSYSTENELQEGVKLNGTKLVTKVHQGVLSNTRVFSPRWLNELRIGYNSFYNSLGTELAFERDVLSELGIPGFTSPAPAAWGSPQMTFTGIGGSFGDNNNGPFSNDNQRIQVVDNVSWTRGTHSLRFGVEVLNDQFNQFGNSFVRGVFAFDGIATQNPQARPTTGNSFADYLLGYQRQVNQAIALADVRFRATSQYYYVDDIWKITPHLTLNLGLRYEYTPPFKDKLGTAVNVDMPFFDQTPNVADLSRHPTFIRIGSGDFYEGTLLRFNPAIKVARDGRLGERLVRNDSNDWAPRFGIAYSPTSKWTVRTGFGVFYSQDQGNARFDMARNLSGRRDEATQADFPNLTFSQPFSDTTSTVQVNAPMAFANIYARRTPYTLQYLLNLQRELKQGTLLEVGYLGSVSRKLEQAYGLNQPVPSAIGSVASRRPYPEFGTIQMLDSIGKGNYDSLAVKLQERFSQGLSYLIGYTWSKSIDLNSGIRGPNTDTLFPNDNYNVQAERALSGFHTAHRFVGSALYELPVGKGKRFLNQGGIVDVLLGGWQVSSIVTLQSGNPMNVRVGGDQSNTGSFAGRMNATGQPTQLPGEVRNTDRWFNTAAYVLQPFGAFGNSGRNTVILPGVILWDFSTQKNFRVAEGQQLQFRFEAFNFTNHPNWGNPGFELLSSDFGVIRSTRTNMRELQFGLKYVF